MFSGDGALETGNPKECPHHLFKALMTFNFTKRESEHMGTSEKMLLIVQSPPSGVYIKFLRGFYQGYIHAANVPLRLRERFPTALLYGLLWASVFSLKGLLRFQVCGEGESGDGLGGLQDSLALGMKRFGVNTGRGRSRRCLRHGQCCIGAFSFLEQGFGVYDTISMIGRNLAGPYSDPQKRSQQVWCTNRHTHTHTCPCNPEIHQHSTPQARKAGTLIYIRPLRSRHCRRQSS